MTYSIIKQTQKPHTCYPSDTAAHDMYKGSIVRCDHCRTYWVKDDNWHWQKCNPQGLIFEENHGL